MKRSQRLIAVFIGLLVLIPAVQIAGQEQTRDIGTFQAILEGDPGEGGLFYRLEFASEGTVNVKQQFNGKNFYETKEWTMDGNTITITSSPGDTLTDFDQSHMVLTEEGNITVTGMPKYGTFRLDYWNGNRAYIYIIATLFILVGLNELFRRVKWTGIVFFFVLPIALIPVWRSYGIEYWFKWAKVYSVAFGSCWFLLMRFTKLDKHNFAKLVCGLILAINILEAVMQDFTMGTLPNILNGLAGVFSMITCFYGWKMIHSDDSKERDMIWPAMTVLWIIAYDVWNFTYVYLNFPGSATAQLQVILAATIPALFIKKGTWLQARGFTLGAWFIFYFTFAEFHGANLVGLPRNYPSMMIFGAASLALNLWCIISWTRTKLKKQETKEKVLVTQ